MIHVYMDDLRQCPQGFVLARTVQECIVLLEECEIGILSLDHDMGWDQPNGYEVVRHLVMHHLYPQEIYLHTSSAAGRANMYRHLILNKPDHVTVYPKPMPQEILDQIAARAKD